MKKLILLTTILFSTFVTQGQNLLTINWDAWDNGSWQNTSRYSYTYDANDYVIHQLEETINQYLGPLQNLWQVFYTNNSNGTVQEAIFQYWDVASSSWGVSARVTYTYSASEKPLTTSIDALINGSWVNRFRNNWSYDINDNLTYFLEERWDTLTNLWNNHVQTSYTSNIDGTINQQTMEQWDVNTNNWVNSTRVTYTYNTSGKVLTELHEHWGGIWVNYNRLTYTYDIDGYLIQCLTEHWDFNSNSWGVSQKDNYTNNANGLIQEIIGEYWDSNLSSWVNLSRGTYIYATTTAITPIEQPFFQIFPNPTKEKLIISAVENIDLIEIIDMQGRLLYSRNRVNNYTAIDVSSLSPNMYLVKIHNGNTFKTAIFVKQ